MQLAARSYLAAGVAVIGASALAISPVTAPAPEFPDIREVASISRNVDLTALANPFAPVFQQALEDFQSLAERIAANPAPVLHQVLINQLTAAQTLGGLAQDYVEGLAHFLTGEGSGTMRGQLELVNERLQAGDYGLAFGYLSALPILALAGGDVFGLLGTVIPTIAGVLQQPFENIAAAIGAIGNPRNITPLALALVQGFNGTAQEIGEGLEGVVAALQGGDPEAVVNAVLVGGANTLDSLRAAVLGSNGLIAGLQSMREAIATAITPPAVALAATATPTAAALAANEVPNYGAPSVTVSTAVDTHDAASAATGVTDETTMDNAAEARNDAQTEAQSAPDETRSAATNTAEEAGATATDTADGAASRAGSGIVRESAKAKAGKTGSTESSIVRESPKAEPRKTGTTSGESTQDDGSVASPSSGSEKPSSSAASSGGSSGSSGSGADGGDSE